MQELIRGLAALVEEPGATTPSLADALELGRSPTPDEHADLLLFQLYPYASVYTGAEGMLGGEARARIGGFWRALGRDVPAEADHLGALLGLWAVLIDAELEEDDPARRPLRRRARAALVHEHLLSWLPLWLERARELAAPPYRRWAEVLAEALRGEATEFEAPAFPVHLAEAPGLVDPRSDPKGFLGGLLAPLRTGMILVRDDLARLARETGLGLRQGERRYVLEALLGQDAGATLAWLGDEAARQAELTAGWCEAAPDVAAFWSGRARGCARLLTELAAEVVPT